MLTLIVLNGQDEGRVFHLDGARAAVLGRQAPHVRLHDTRISRRHCEITCRDGQWFVRDLGSSNGTGINGKRITGPTPLNEGDQLWVGRLRMVVGFTAADAEDGAPEPFRLEVGESIGERLAAGEAAASGLEAVAEDEPAFDLGDGSVGDDSGGDDPERDADEAGDDAEDIAAEILLADEGDDEDDIPPPPGRPAAAVADDTPPPPADDDDALADAWDLASDQPRTSGPPAAALDPGFDDDEADEDELTLVPSSAAARTPEPPAQDADADDEDEHEDEDEGEHEDEDWGPTLDEAAEAAGGAPAGIGATDDEDEDIADDDPLAALIDQVDDADDADDAEDADDDGQDDDLYELAAVADDEPGGDAGDELADDAGDDAPLAAAGDEVELSDLGLSDVELEPGPAPAIPVEDAEDVDPTALPTARVVTRKAGDDAAAPPPSDAASDAPTPQPEPEPAPEPEPDAAPAPETDAAPAPEPEPVAVDPAVETRARDTAVTDAAAVAGALAADARAAEAAAAAERTARRVAVRDAAEAAGRLRDRLTEAAAAETREAEARSVGAAVAEARAAADALDEHTRAQRVARAAAASRSEETAQAAEARALGSTDARRRHTALRLAAAAAAEEAERAGQLALRRREQAATSDAAAEPETGDPLSTWVDRYVGGEADEPAARGAVESIAPGGVDEEQEQEQEQTQEQQESGEVQRLIDSPSESEEPALAHGTSELFGEGPSPRAPEPPADPGPMIARPRAAPPLPTADTAAQRRRRAALLVGGLAVVVTLGLVGYGVWGGDDAATTGGPGRPVAGAGTTPGGDTSPDSDSDGGIVDRPAFGAGTDPGALVLAALGPGYAGDAVDTPRNLPAGLRSPDEALFGSGLAVRGFGAGTGTDRSPDGGDDPLGPTAADGAGDTAPGGLGTMGAAGADAPSPTDDTAGTPDADADAGADAGVPEGDAGDTGNTGDTGDPLMTPAPGADAGDILAGLPGLPPADDTADPDADDADVTDDAAHDRAESRWDGLPDPDVAARTGPGRGDVGRIDPRLGVDPSAVLEGEGPHRVVFLVDGSGSTLEVLPHARAWVRGAVAGLGPDDRFGVIMFRSTGDEVGSPNGLQPATGDRKSAMLEWLDPVQGGWRLGGRSDPRAAVRTALDQGATHLVIVSHSRFARRVAQDMTPAELVKSAVGDATPRVSTVLLVHEDPRGALESVAEAFDGVFQWVRPRDGAAGGAWLGDATRRP